MKRGMTYYPEAIKSGTDEDGSVWLLLDNGMKIYRRFEK